MLASEVSEQPVTSLTHGGSLGQQRTLATVLAVPAFCLLVAGLVMAADIIGGELKMLKAFPVVAAIAFAGCGLSYSLFRGRGVPSWCLRAVWTSIPAGIAYFAISETWKLGRGEAGDLAGVLLVSGMAIYFCISTFKVFWASK